jgi:hypothetical protein
MTNQILHRVWLIECFRCAHSDYSAEPDSDDAMNELLSLGWTVACDGYVMCPQCQPGPLGPLQMDRSHIGRPHIHSPLWGPPI